MVLKTFMKLKATHKQIYDTLSSSIFCVAANSSGVGESYLAGASESGLRASFSKLSSSDSKMLAECCPLAPLAIVGLLSGVYIPFSTFMYDGLFNKKIYL